MPFLRLLACAAGLVLALSSTRAVGPLPEATSTAVPAVLPECFLPQLTTQLVDHFHSAGELQLDLLRSWSPVPTPSAPWTMQVITPPLALGTQNIVRVRLVADRHNLGEWNLPLRAQLWADALVARQPIARGTALDAGLFEIRRIDLLREKDSVSATTDLAGLSLARAIAIGAVVTWRDVARRALVQRGETVDVNAADGALTITLKALALQSGALGDNVLVRNPESRRDFTAVVTAEKKVRVDF